MAYSLEVNMASTWTERLAELRAENRWFPPPANREDYFQWLEYYFQWLRTANYPVFLLLVRAERLPYMLQAKAECEAPILFSEEIYPDIPNSIPVYRYNNADLSAFWHRVNDLEAQSTKD